MGIVVIINRYIITTYSYYFKPAVTGGLFIYFWNTEISVEYLLSIDLIYRILYNVYTNIKERDVVV